MRAENLGVGCVEGFAGSVRVEPEPAGSPRDVVMLSCTSHNQAEESSLVSS